MAFVDREVTGGRGPPPGSPGHLVQLDFLYDCDRSDLYGDEGLPIGEVGRRQLFRARQRLARPLTAMLGGGERR